MVFPTPDIVAPALCTPSGDPRICGWAETVPGQVAALLCSSGASRAYNTVENSLYNIGRPQIGLKLPASSLSPFLWIT